MEHDAFILAKFIKSCLKSHFIDPYKKNNEPAPLEKLTYYNELKSGKTSRALRLDFQDETKYLILIVKQK